MFYIIYFIKKQNKTKLLPLTKNTQGTKRKPGRPWKDIDFSLKSVDFVFIGYGEETRNGCKSGKNSWSVTNTYHQYNFNHVHELNLYKPKHFSSRQQNLSVIWYRPVSELYT